MRFRRCDRYLLREVAAPFVVAAAALFLFIVLSLVLSLSDLMVDRGAGVGTLLRLLVLKSPVMLVLALPVSGLFAMFLGLGRMAHDREILAFEAAGVSLRRLTVPLILFAVAVSVTDFALYNWGVPSSELKYQQVLQGVIYRSGVPTIRSNTFFSGPNGEVYFVRQYDESNRTLRDVVIYDVQGRLIPQAEANLLMVTAEQGVWNASSWILEEGHAYGYDEDGALLYSGTFAELEVPLDLEPSGIYASSRPATAMSMGELGAQIELQRERGMNSSSLEMEYHRKVAVPLASIVFVLLGASLSLIYGWKSRGTGIAISFIVVGAYQGFYVWMGSLGGGSVVAPWVAAWLPNILFGSVALLIFLRLDRLGSRSVLRRLRRLVPFLGVIAMLGVGTGAANGQETVGIRADAISVDAGGRQFVAAGAVEILLGETSLRAERIDGVGDADGGWRLAAEGGVRFADDNGLSLAAERATISVESDGETWHPIQGSIGAFELRGTFLNSAGDENVLWVRGVSGDLRFSGEGEIERIDVSEAQFSTCERCQTCTVGGDYAFRSQPYALSAQRVTFYPDRLILAARVTGYLFGLPVVWVPAYVQPLEETLSSPLFPAIGRDAARGWYLKWNVPFFFSDEAYGVILFDLFAGVRKIGFGGELRYTGGRHDAQLVAYAYPSEPTDSIYTFEFSDSLGLGHDWELGASVQYAQDGMSRELDYESKVAGPVASGMMELAAARERVFDDEGEELRVTDRLPELTFSGAGWAFGPITLVPVVGVGHLRETLPADADSEDDATSQVEVVRARAGATASTAAFSVLGYETRPRLTWEVDRYWISGAVEQRQTINLSLRAESALGILLDYRLIHVWGVSPLVGDGVTRKHEVRVDVFREGVSGLDLRVAGGVDLAELEPLPVNLDASWRGETGTGQSVVADVSADYSLIDAAVGEVKASAEWIGTAGWRASASSGIDVAEGEWLPVIWSLHDESSGGWWRVSSSGAYNPNAFTVTRADLGVEIEPLELRDESPEENHDSGNDRGSPIDVDRLVGSIEYDAGIWELAGRLELSAGNRWGASLGGRWSSDVGVLTPEIGVFREFSDCLRIGIESTRSTTWLYISVQAFPEAILRYAPGQGSVEIGT